MLRIMHRKNILIKYKGKFDQGWDKLREETFAKQKALGVIPQNAHAHSTSKRNSCMGDQTPDQKKLFARQMETLQALLNIRIMK